MTNEADFIVLWTIHIAVTVSIIFAMYIKRKVFASTRDAFLIICFGAAIIISIILLNSHAKGSSNIAEVKAFLLLREYDENWGLTRIYLFGHAILVAGISALFLSLMKKKSGK